MFGNILKLGIVQAFMEGQELVVLDELTKGLDTASLDQLKLLLQDLRIKRHTVLVTAYDERFIGELADEVYRLDRGRIVDSWSHRAT
ncbi:hypothetical protein [Lactobacillus xylocopicola]|uniref:Uncharacterized protein n=1 Tax=Lactobacillus xylocopicola TaxID=2976676 RepID=A0ABM8BIA8_9LACO|nr:hypothetical protein [Lactobacillus xylocopicola]BDR60854.1 hypothetical protein KIM322_11150 [Lactobacillus xylocopicola]